MGMESVISLLIIKSLYNQLSRLYKWYNESYDVERYRYCQDMEGVLEKIVAEWHRLSNPYVFYDEVLLLQYLSMIGAVTQDLLYGFERFKRGWSWYDVCNKISHRWLYG